MHQAAAERLIRGDNGRETTLGRRRHRGLWKDEDAVKSDGVGWRGTVRAVESDNCKLNLDGEFMAAGCDMWDRARQAGLQPWEEEEPVAAGGGLRASHD